MLVLLIFTIFLSLKSVYIINIVTSTFFVSSHATSFSYFFSLNARDQTQDHVHAKHALYHWVAELHPQTFFIYFWHSPCSLALCWSQIPGIAKSSCFSFPGVKDGRCMLLLCYLHLFTFSVHIFIFQIHSFNGMKLTAFTLSEKACLLLQCTNEAVPFLWHQYTWFNSRALLFVYCLPHWFLTESYSYASLELH